MYKYLYLCVYTCTYTCGSYVIHVLLNYPLIGDYSGSSSSEEEDEDQSSPRERVLKNSKGQSDFRIKDIKIAPYGRKEIDMAEQGSTHSRVLAISSLLPPAILHASRC